MSTHGRRRRISRSAALGMLAFMAVAAGLVWAAELAARDGQPDFEARFQFLAGVCTAMGLLAPLAFGEPDRKQREQSA